MSEKDQDSALSETPGAGTPGVNAVEIKFTVRPDQELYAVRALNLEFSKAQQRQIYFVDSAQLELYDQGLIMRARTKGSGDDDSTVKVRPVEPGTITGDWQSLAGFKIEADIVGDKVIRSASLSALQKQGEIPDAADGKRPIDKLFSQDQERFARIHAVVTPEYPQLRLLGPVEVLRWKITDKRLPYEMTVEEWRLPDATDLLEISIKVAPEEEQEAVAAFQAYLRGLNLDLAGAQQTKTRMALEYFATQR